MGLQKFEVAYFNSPHTFSLAGKHNIIIQDLIVYVVENPQQAAVYQIKPVVHQNKSTVATSLSETLDANCRQPQPAWPMIKSGGTSSLYEQKKNHGGLGPSYSVLTAAKQ